MDIRRFAPTLLLLLCLMFAAPDLISSAQSPPADRGEGPDMTQLLAQFDQEVRDKADAPLQTGKQRLADAYRASLEAGLKKAAAAGSLDDAVAMKTESARFAESGSVPEKDEAGTAAEVAKLRNSWRAEMARLEKQSAAARQPLLEAHIARLRQLEKNLTRALKIDEAQAVRAKVESLLAAAPAPPRPVATPLTIPPPAIAATPRPAVTFAPLARPVERVDLYASGSNGCSIYINNKEAAPTVMRDKATKVRVSLHEGDIIAIRNKDRYDINSFWLSANATTGEFLFETSLDWHSYLPRSPDKWWEVKSAKEQGPVQFAPNSQEYVDLVKQSASRTPVNRGAQPIRSMLLDPTIVRPPAYCYYIVTKQDLLPKNAETPAAGEAKGK